MADKMMRIAGRGEDGLAKAFAVDNAGKLRLSGEQFNIYSEGIENVSMSQDSMKPEGDTSKSRVTKHDNHIELYAGDADTDAHAIVATDTKISVDGITQIIVDWEQSGFNSSGNQSVIALTNNRLEGPSGGGERRVTLTHSFGRRLTALNVSNFTGEFYLRLMARDSIVGALVTSKLRIYNIYLYDGVTLKTYDEALNKNIDKMVSAIPLQKRTLLTDNVMLTPGAEIALTTNFKLPDSVSAWKLYFLEIQRPYLETLEKLEITIEFSTTVNSYFTPNTLEILNGGLIFREKVELSDTAQTGKGLITPLDSAVNGSNIILQDEYYNVPLAEYMRVLVKNNGPSNARIVRPTLMLEGNF